MKKQTEIQKKERNPSRNYALKQLRGAIKKTLELKLVNEKEGEQLKALYKTIIQREIGDDQW